MDFKELNELSRKIIAYRAKYGLSQLEFAKKCKISQQTACNIENCVQRPGKMTLQKILNVIGE